MILFGIDSDHAIVNKKTGKIVYHGGQDAVVSNHNYSKTDIIDTGKDYIMNMWIKKPDKTNWTNEGHGRWTNNRLCKNTQQDLIRTLRQDEMYSTF